MFLGNIHLCFFMLHEIFWIDQPPALAPIIFHLDFPIQPLFPTNPDWLMTQCPCRGRRGTPKRWCTCWWSTDTQLFAISRFCMSGCKLLSPNGWPADTAPSSSLLHNCTCNCAPVSAAQRGLARRKQKALIMPSTVLFCLFLPGLRNSSERVSVGGQWWVPILNY